MDWADELAASVSGPQVVNDSKTPSGTVHVGSLRGPVILDVIVRALRRRGLDTTLLYGVDDMDPMDAQALLTPDAVDHEMGRPLAHVPDQVKDGHLSYARHHAQVFLHGGPEVLDVVQDEERAGHDHRDQAGGQGDEDQLPLDGEAAEPLHYFTTVAMRSRLASNSLPSDREEGRLMRMSGFLSAFMPIPTAMPRCTNSGTPVAVVMA